MGEPFGLKAKDFMSKLLNGKQVTCKPDGTVSFDRKVANHAQSRGRSNSWIPHAANDPKSQIVEPTLRLGGRQCGGLPA